MKEPETTLMICTACDAGCALVGVEVGVGVPEVCWPGLRVDPGLGVTF